MKRAETLDTRPAPLAMTIMLMMRRMKNTNRPTLKLPSIRNAPNFRSPAPPPHPPDARDQHYADFSMFGLGTAMLAPEARGLSRVNADSLRGYIDALTWKPGVRTNNWWLSTGRGGASRQELLRAGVEENRFDRIEGVADRELLVADDPANPRNRRISV
ncbi:MAG: hypothetical protein WA948_01440 [Pontixanthobacter sp.]